jgi:hypothetical protein
MSGDYIPTIEERLLPFAKTLSAYALAHFARWSDRKNGIHAVFSTEFCSVPLGQSKLAGNFQRCHPWQKNNCFGAWMRPTIIHRVFCAAKLVA